MICDGYDEEDVRRVIELNIVTHGWHVAGVVPGHDEPGNTWAYTIGLTESHGLPELVVTDVAWPHSGRLLNWAAGRLIDGGTLDDLEGERVSWVPVDDAYRDTDLLIGWYDYYRSGSQEGRFVQLLPAFDADCPCCPDRMADLSDSTDPFMGAIQ